MKDTLKPQVAILADDLNSAADGSGPFVGRGLTATVRRHQPPESSHADVLAVDMGTRSMPEDEAVEAVCRVVTDLRQARILYKTVDSTLRGHVRAEIGAAALTAGRSRVVFAPAFPDAGRVTRDGIQLVGGIPVDRSPYADDPTHPVCTARLADLIPSTVRNVIILDAETQEDLNRQLAAIPDPEDVLWIGSPGMPIPLSQLFKGRSSAVSFDPIVGGVLLVVGSANRVSHAQADRVEGKAGITVLRAPTARVADVAGTLARLTEDAVAAIRTGRYGTVLATGGDTMEAILNGLDVAAFDLTGEIEIGFPTAVVTFQGRPLKLGMKAGGFGQIDTLLRAARQLTKLWEIPA